MNDETGKSEDGAQDDRWLDVVEKLNLILGKFREKLKLSAPIISSVKKCAAHVG